MIFENRQLCATIGSDLRTDTQKGKAWLQTRDKGELGMVSPEFPGIPGIPAAKDKNLN